MMRLKTLLPILSSFALVLASFPTFAQAPGIPEGPMPGTEEVTPMEPTQEAPIPTEPVPAEEPSVEPVTPESEPTSNEPVPAPAPIGGGNQPTGEHTLVSCGPGGAASIVKKVRVGCHILDVNSPPGQTTNAISSDQ